jgi:flagellin
VDFQSQASMTVNSQTITVTASDGVSNQGNTESALAYVTAINSVSGSSGVTASVLTNVVTGGDVTAGQAIGATQTVSINGVAMTAKAYTADATGADSLAADINSISTQTGVTATRSGNYLKLSATDGRNINVTISGVSGVSAAWTADAASSTVSLGFVGLAAGGAVHSSLVSTNVGITAGYRGTFRLTSDTSFTLANTTAVIGSTTAVATSTTATLSTVSVASADNAQTAIYILDNTLRQLQTRRSSIGSKSTRLDAARSELQSRKENISSAESNIRDTDIAQETANLTQMQILQQAGVSVLSKANQLPQLALKLLE